MELEGRARRVGDLDAAAAALERREAEVAQRLERALAAERAVQGFRSTRRFRLARALAAPADLVRGRGR